MEFLAIVASCCVRTRFTDSLRDRSPEPSCSRFCEDERERFSGGTTADAAATTAAMERGTSREDDEDVDVEDAAAEGV